MTEKTLKHFQKSDHDQGYQSPMCSALTDPHSHPPHTAHTPRHCLFLAIVIWTVKCWYPTVANHIHCVYNGWPRGLLIWNSYHCSLYAIVHGVQGDTDKSNAKISILMLTQCAANGSQTTNYSGWLRPFPSSPTTGRGVPWCDVKWAMLDGIREWNIPTYIDNTTHAIKYPDHQCRAFLMVSWVPFIVACICRLAAGCPISKMCRGLDLEGLDGTPYPSWPQMSTTVGASAWVKTWVKACLKGPCSKAKPFVC